jgi:hypothetical protein
MNFEAKLLDFFDTYLLPGMCHCNTFHTIGTPFTTPPEHGILVYQDGSAGRHFDVFKMPDDTFVVHTLRSCGPERKSVVSHDCCSTLSQVFYLISI